MGKAIIRSEKLDADNVVEHWINFNANFCNSKGEPTVRIDPENLEATQVSNYTYDRMFLHHYRYKTISEYINNRLVKFLKPKDQSNLEIVFYYLIEFFKHNEMTNEKVKYLCDYYNLTKDKFYEYYDFYNKKLNGRNVLKTVKEIVQR